MSFALKLMEALAKVLVVQLLVLVLELVLGLWELQAALQLTVQPAKEGNVVHIQPLAQRQI